MEEHFCFWTVVSPSTKSVAERLVTSARQNGIFKHIHIWTDEVIPESICHPLGDYDPTDGIFRLTYLRNSVAKLPYDYFIWLDPSTRFLHHPGSMLRVLRRSPVHVPLTFNLNSISVGLERWGGGAPNEIAREMRNAGVVQRMVFGGHSGFFIVHRNAVETFFELAFVFWTRCSQLGMQLSCEPILAYACQMLAGDPRLHHVSHSKDLWLPNEMRGGDRLGPAIIC